MGKKEKCNFQLTIVLIILIFIPITVHSAHKSIRFCYSIENDSILKEVFLFRGTKIRTLKRIVLDYDSIRINNEKTEALTDIEFSKEKIYKLEGYKIINQNFKESYLKGRAKELTRLLGKGESFWRYYWNRLKSRPYPTYLKVLDGGALCLGGLLTLSIVGIPAVIVMSAFYAIDGISILTEELFLSIWEYYIGY